MVDHCLKTRSDSDCAQYVETKQRDNQWLNQLTGLKDGEVCIERKYMAKFCLRQQGNTTLGPWQIKVSHKHYPEATHKVTESNPESNKFCSIPIPAPSPLHTQKRYFVSWAWLHKAKLLENEEERRWHFFSPYSNMFHESEMKLVPLWQRLWDLISSHLQRISVTWNRLERTEKKFFMTQHLICGSHEWTDGIPIVSSVVPSW